MSELIHGKKVFSLAEVAESIKKTFESRYTTSFWVMAEMNKLNHYHHSGHCYPELVEKKDGKVVAQMRSHLWKADFNRINRNFLRVLKEPLKEGVKVLFSAKLNFDPVYGVSLWILDIDPAYTLGDLEREKQETIAKLRESGCYEWNKLLPLPLLPQRIAVISVETSKGYADFLNVLEKNEWKYAFFKMLFPALLQGDAAAPSIIHQLNRIRKAKNHFDAVVIIRGGGGDVGLSCYNHYQLAETICRFPIPVLTGIGHSTNETVAEMVAHANAITPTKLAEMLLQRFHNFAFPLAEAEMKIVREANFLMSAEHDALSSTLRLFQSAARSLLNAQAAHVDAKGDSLIRNSRFVMKAVADNRIQTMTQLKDASLRLMWQHQSETGALEKAVELLNPLNVLKRGYSITRRNGLAVKDASMLNAGDVIETFFADGAVQSVVQKIKNQTHE